MFNIQHPLLLIAISLFVGGYLGFLFGKHWKANAFLYRNSYTWWGDESLMAATKLIMGQPNATDREVHLWSSSPENMHYNMILERCRLDPALTKEIKRHYKMIEHREARDRRLLAQQVSENIQQYKLAEGLTVEQQAPNPNNHESPQNHSGTDDASSN